MVTAEEIISLKGTNIVSIERDTVVIKAIQKMVENKIGALSVTKNGEIIGIWTERDLLRNSICEGFDMNTAKVGDCMLTNFNKMPHTATLYELEAAFLGLRARYLFITRNDMIIGMISAGDLMKTHLNLKHEEVEQLRSYVSMEYYENWKWDAKKR